MYKALVRTMIRRSIGQLNAGDLTTLRRLTAPDAELCFPGDNSWARQFRPVSKQLTATVTHAGHDELERFAEMFVASGLRIEVDDIVVNGPPWNTRACVRGTESAVDASGHVVYENRMVTCIESRWGVIRRWEDYLDTERISEWDARIAATGMRAAATPGATTERSSTPVAL